MATDYKALGKRISNARKQAGITQEALGNIQTEIERNEFTAHCQSLERTGCPAAERV